jgi:hypothetical protein
MLEELLHPFLRGMLFRHGSLRPTVIDDLVEWIVDCWVEWSDKRWPFPAVNRTFTSEMGKACAKLCFLRISNTM